MYWVINEKGIETAVEKSIEDKACKFEGWNIRIDYNDVQQESFVLCSLLCLIKNHIIEVEQKRHLLQSFQDICFDKHMYAIICGNIIIPWFYV